MTRWDFKDGSWLEEHPPTTIDPNSYIVNFRWTSYGWKGCQAYAAQAERYREIRAAAAALKVAPGLR